VHIPTEGEHAECRAFNSTNNLLTYYTVSESQSGNVVHKGSADMPA